MGWVHRFRVTERVQPLACSDGGEPQLKGVGCMPGRRRSVPFLLDVDELDYLPPVVFVAARSSQLGDAELVFETRETKAGAVALMAYSSWDKLVAGCGSGQSWARVPSVDLARMRPVVGFDVVMLDVSLPVELRHPDLDAHEVPYVPDALSNGRVGDVVWIPSQPVRPGDQRANLELHPDPQGRLAVLAYTSPQQLWAGCGPHQPCVAVRTENLQRVARNAGAATVLFNPYLDEQCRHQANDFLDR